MKKGFTLIELLAVIVILAIIALIAVPLILNMIEESRIKSAVISGGNYVKAVNYKIAQEELNGRPIVINPEDNLYVIGENELAITADNIENITGEYILDTVGVTWAGLCVNNYPVVYYEGKASYDKNADYCGGDTTHFVEPDAEFVSAICEGPNGNDIYNDNTYFKIKSVEDLTCLSNSTSDGKDFDGKTIYLLNDIDLSQSSSYKKAAGTKYGDVNGNGTVEGLHTELTTGAGFKPIGTSNKPFKGTFKGYAFTISNLMINRPSESNVGLFGVAEGVISGVKLRNANVIGYDNVGILIGLGYRSASNIDIKGTVKGRNSVGGVAGNFNSSTLSDAVFSGTVEGNSSVGGATGGGGSYKAFGVIYDTTVKSTGGSNAGKVGYGNLYQSDVMVKNVTKIPDNNNGVNGTEFTENDMLIFDRVLDTVIGGDNNNDGYYFDYDSDGNMTLYSIERKAIKNKLKGTGTEESPYIIRNTDDWRMASATIGSEIKYYSVINNLDFTDKRYYPLGTNANKFTGVIKGNYHTISNVTVHGDDNVGLFGYNTGTIKDFKFNNITITGTGSNVGLIGVDEGNVGGIIIRNINVTGYDNVGSLIGLGYRSVKNIDIKGTVKGRNSVGGVAGNFNSSTLSDFVFSGSVEGSSSVGGATGGGGSYRAFGVIYDTTVKSTGGSNAGKVGYGNLHQSDVMVRNVTKIPDNNNGVNGTEYTENDMVTFDRVLDTIIGGDNDKDGYYFDYDETGNIALKIVAESPIGNSFRGSGTEQDPYLIATVNDWNSIGATIDSTPKYYSVTENIDFTGKVYYPIGTANNKFNGVIKGNNHTISNVTVHGDDNVGLFGYNTGTITGFKFNNITVAATGSNAGIIGVNEGNASGIIARNINVTGYDNVGILIGLGYRSVKNVDIRGTVKGRNNVGGVAGNFNSSTLSDFVFSGSVEGSSSVGGATGAGGSYRAFGVIYDTTVKSTGGSNAGKVGYGNLYQSDVMVGNVTKNPDNNNGVNGTAYTTNDMVLFDRVLDTYIGGDNDSDGYYFDYDSNGKLIMYITSENPIRNTLSGSGTENDPYLISSPSDWKMATALATKSKYFSITADINFNNATYYQLGTNANKFNGTLKGNNHTISNVSVNGDNNVGLFGYNTGTIKGLKFNNITITGTGDNVGIIGVDEGNVSGIVGRNINVTGNDNVGSLIGLGYRSVKTIDMKGTVKGRNNVGGVAGNFNSSTLSDFVFSGSVEGSSSVGGATGSGGSYRAFGVIYNTIVKSTGGSNAGKVGYGNLYQYNVMVSNVTKIPDNNNGINGTEFNSITLEAVDSVLDTTIGGDNDSDGYYFTLNNGNYELIPSN